MIQVTGGQFKGRKLKVPSSARPTLSKVRESFFNTLACMIDFEGKSFLDLYSGSGIMGIEALSRGFGKVLAVEKDENAIRYLITNYKMIEQKPNYRRDYVLNFLNRLQKQYDVIFMDPPYEGGEYKMAAGIIRVRNLLSKGGILVCEHNPRNEFRLEGYEFLKIKVYGLCALSFFRIENA